MIETGAVRVTIFPRIVVDDAWTGSRAARTTMARAISAAARTTASAHRKTGAYAASMSVSVKGNIVRAISTDPLAVPKEYGTAHSKGTGALTQAASSIGRRYQGFKVR